MNVSTWAVLFGELLLGILIWVRRCRPTVIVLGVTLHVAIMVTVAVGFFSPEMVLLYLAFIPSEAVQRWVCRRAGPVT